MAGAPSPKPAADAVEAARRASAAGRTASSRRTRPLLEKLHSSCKPTEDMEIPPSLRCSASPLSVTSTVGQGRGGRRPRWRAGAAAPRAARSARAGSPPRGPDPRRQVGGEPSHGSSSSSTRGWASSARAIASICCSPPESWLPRWRSRAASRGSSSRTRATVHAGAGRAPAPAARARCSATVRLANTRRPCGTSPTPGPGDPVRRPAGEVDAVEPDAPAYGRSSPATVCDQRGLARAVAARPRPARPVGTPGRPRAGRAAAVAGGEARRIRQHHGAPPRRPRPTCGREPDLGGRCRWRPCRPRAAR